MGEKARIYMNCLTDRDNLHDLPHRKKDKLHELSQIDFFTETIQIWDSQNRLSIIFLIDTSLKVHFFSLTYYETTNYSKYFSMKIMTDFTYNPFFETEHVIFQCK